MDGYTEAQICARLQPATDLIGTAIPKAVAAAKKNFSVTRPMDATTFATLFRYEMKLMLRSHNYLVAEDSEIALATKNLANVGLQFTFNEIEAKILKGSDGKLPGASTESRVAFYCQPELALGEYTQPSGPVRVVYLWEHESLDAETRAWLIRPRHAALRDSQVECHWGAPIPLVKRISPNTEHTREQVRRDLPIGIPTSAVSPFAGE